MSSVAAFIHPIYIFFLVLSACIAICSCYMASRWIHTTKDIALIKKCFGNCFMCGLFLMIFVIALPYTSTRGIVNIVVMILPTIVFCIAYGYVYYAMVYIIVPAEVSAEEEKGNVIKGTLFLMIEKYPLVPRMIKTLCNAFVSSFFAELFRLR